MERTVYVGPRELPTGRAAPADRAIVDRRADQLLDVQHQRPRAHSGDAGAAVRSSDELSRSVIAALETGVIVLDAHGMAISVNESGCRILGVSQLAVLGRRPPYLGDHQVFLEDGRRVTTTCDPGLAALADGMPREDVLMRRFEAEIGQTTWLSVSCRPLLRDGDTAPYGLVYSIADVTERKRFERNMREERDRARSYLELAGTMIVVLNTDGSISVLNRAAHEVLGYDEGALYGRDWFQTCVPAEEREQVRAVFERCVQGDIADDEEAVEHGVVTRRGEARIVSWKNAVMRDEHGRVSGVLSSGVDITERREAERQVSYLAHHDGLTGLPNRALLEEHLRKALARSRRTGNSVGVLFVDLDGFKLVNDSLGHASGDDVLREAAERLAMTTRASDLLARQGGDEFLLLLGDVARDKDPEEVAVAASKRILEALSEPFQVAGAEFQLGASIGIALYPRDAHDPDGLLKAADGAMYRAKRAGRGAYAFPEPDDNSDARARLSLTSRLRRALARDELELHFQPVFSVEGGELISAEALLRWTDPTDGPIPPGVFVPVAEETGVMGALGDWMLDRLCRHARDWS